MADSATPLDDAIIRHEGYLERRKAGKLRATWSREWFHLSAEFLVSFPSRSSNHVLCCIPQRALLASEASPTNKKAAESCQFTVRFTHHFGHSPCDKTGALILRAATAAEADAWMRAIRQGQDLRRRTDHFIPHMLAKQHISEAQSLASSCRASHAEMGDRCAALEASVAEYEQEVQRLRSELAAQTEELEKQTTRADETAQKVAELGDVHAEYRTSRQELMEARAVTEELTSWQASIEEQLRGMEGQIRPWVDAAEVEEASQMASAATLEREAAALRQQAEEARQELELEKGSGLKRERPLPELRCLQLCFKAWHFHVLHRSSTLGDCSLTADLEAIRLAGLSRCLTRLQHSSLRLGWHKICTAAAAAARRSAVPSDCALDVRTQRLASLLVPLVTKPLLACLTTWKMKTTLASWQLKVPVHGGLPSDLPDGDAAAHHRQSGTSSTKDTDGQLSPSPVPSTSADAAMPKQVASPSQLSSVALASEPAASPKSAAGGDFFSEDTTLAESRDLPNKQLQTNQKEPHSNFRQWQEEWRESEQRWWKALAEVVAGSGSETGSSLGSRAGERMRSQSSGPAAWVARSDVDSDGSEVDLSFQIEDPAAAEDVAAPLQRQAHPSPTRLASDDAASFARCQHILQVMAAAEAPSDLPGDPGPAALLPPRSSPVAFTPPLETSERRCLTQPEVATPLAAPKRD
eukprot:CAMPEP_0178391746 /NCGR_PEP_ID=MMETSP0689_2-20121128/11323_1 /TAXON_ID=160604 /ORGANISM="Amphidinium massartii, Strain CS-259" /LENGTH=694 /DNA_ID=CAMNT_0020012301 /DNA_START=73 /DNA_END=2154 /DNA_ORIENTATION=+